MIDNHERNTIINNRGLRIRATAFMIAIIIAVTSIGCTSNEKQYNKASALNINESESEHDNSVNVSEDLIETEEDTGDNNISVYINERSDSLTSTQRNSINMLNYIAVLTQEINDSKESRLFLESAYSSLINNTYPNAVDSRTQSKLVNILDTLENYRMLTVKRERLDYIYEQNRADALRKAIPNPIGLLSAVQSGNALKAAISVIYMAVDAKMSYDSAIAQADLQYLKDGWELDDEEAAGVHNSRKDTFTYMLDMVRDNSLPGECTLNEEAVQSFVEWKNNTNDVRKIAWFETNQNTYKDFGPYWLELAKSYFNTDEYSKCLEAVKQYESVSTRIFRKDYNYAKVLPMAIYSAKVVLNESNYISVAEEYLKKILDNTDEDDTTLRYYVALAYIELSTIANDEDYLNKAYKIAFENVNVLIDAQKSLNKEYVEDIKTIDVGSIKVDKNANEEKKKKNKREKKEAKEYNKQLKEERKKALPPVNESLYLNCDLLFALAEKINISDKERERINAILHENGENIFLSEVLDNKFRFGNDAPKIETKELEVKYDKDSITIPVTLVTNKAKISVRVTNSKGSKTIEDWAIDEVKRINKNDYSTFTAIYKSKKAENIKYDPGNKVIVTITPVDSNPNEKKVFEFAIVKKQTFLFDTVEFERK